MNDADLDPSKQLWTQLAADAGVTLDASRVAALSRYLDLLIEANARMNLTRITDRAAAELQHVADALTVLRHLPRGAARLADVGTGGGVPGIPLAIARPELMVTLIESTKKKTTFLTEAVAQLGLSNVRVATGRAEDLAQVDSKYRETFDVAVARAVATMDWLAEWCLPLVKKGGRVLAMKGPKVNEELPVAAKAIKLLGGGEPVVHAVSLPGTEHRVIVQIAKVAKTPGKLPRRASDAKGKPIG